MWLAQNVVTVANNKIENKDKNTSGMWVQLKSPHKLLFPYFSVKIKSHSFRTLQIQMFGFPTWSKTDALRC